MPIYEFVCESCTHEFEKIVSFSAAIAPTCPVCEGDSVKRLMSKPAIHFKGSGWYITDSKADTKKSNGNGANGHDKSKDGESAKSTSDDAVASESTKADGAKADAVKTDSAKADSPKSEGVKSDSATKSTVKADG
jgi:putative FmdB family regulatory protein